MSRPTPVATAAARGPAGHQLGRNESQSYKAVSSAKVSSHTTGCPVFSAPPRGKACLRTSAPSAGFTIRFRTDEPKLCFLDNQGRRETAFATLRIRGWRDRHRLLVDHIFFKRVPVNEV
jgi:hypothetical protein